MIVSDTHRFVFVHIPKCAGSSIRRELAPYDDTHGAYDRKIVDHPELGRIDLTHLPLDLLERVAPEAHAKLSGPDYAGYAVLRDPYDRFPSSVAQRLKMFEGIEMAQADTATLRRTVAQTMETISADPHGIDPVYIHFRRQVDYVVQDGRQMVDALYTIDGVAAFMADIAARIGIDPPQVRHVNQTRTMKVPALRAPARLASRAVKRVLPAGASKSVLTRARRNLLAPIKRPRPEVFDTAEIKAFIAEHYADDIALYDRVSAGDAAQAIPA